MLYATVRQRKIHVKNPVTVIQNGIGVDQVVLDMDDEWKAMTSIVCVFKNGDTAKEQLYSYGQLLEVPWECLTQTGLLSLSCTGYVGSEKVMTTMLPDSYWNVVQNGPVTGDVPLEPTPTLYEQILEAAAAANAAAEQLLTDKENGVFDGAAGRGISSMTYSSAANKWNVCYTDGTTEEVDGPAIPNDSGCMPKSGGTFTGAVAAMNGVNTAAQLRNTALVSDETYPTANGQINWQYA